VLTCFYIFPINLILWTGTVTKGKFNLIYMMIALGLVWTNKTRKNFTKVWQWMISSWQALKITP